MTPATRQKFQPQKRFFASNLQSPARVSTAGCGAMRDDCDTEAEMQLGGKNVVVIGGSRGLGRVIVKTLHGAGASVTAVARAAGPLGQLAAALPGLKTLA